LEQDISEKNNLEKQFPKRVDELRKVMKDKVVGDIPINSNNKNI